MSYYFKMNKSKYLMFLLSQHTKLSLICLRIVVGSFLPFLLLSQSVNAQQPSCVVRPSASHPNFWQYSFGDYVEVAFLGCELRSGEGIELEFNRTPGDSTGVTTHFSINVAKSSKPPLESLTWTDTNVNTLFRMDRRTYEQSAPSLEQLPAWVEKLIEQNQNIFKRHMPKGHAAWEKIYAEKTRNLQAAKLAQESQKREVDERAAKQFREGLSSQTAGQLFAKADELNAQGDTAKARETLRLLVSKFPDHPLAATAAQQMAALNNAAASNSNAAAATSSQVANRSSPSAGGKPFADCVAADQRSDLPQKMARIPQNDLNRTLRGAITASQWMVENYSQCLPDPKAKEIVDQFRKTRQEAITTCKQLSSAGNCEIAPW